MKNPIIKFSAFACLLTSVISLASCTPGDSKIELRIGFWPENTETRDVAMYTEWKKQFENDYPQYKVVGDPYSYDTATIGQKYITKTLPTVFQTWFTEPLKLKTNKYIRSIDKQLKAAHWDECMDVDMKNALTFDGEIYGIPRDGYGLGLLINIKTLGENGLLPEKDGKYVIYNDDGTPAYPTTFEEIYEAALQISEYDDKKGILICSANKNGGWQFSNMAWNYGAVLQNEVAGKITANLNSEESVEALSWIQKMKQEDLLLNSVSVTYDQWYNSIGDKVAMAIVGSDVLQLATMNGEVPMDDLAFVPMPTGDGVHHYSLYGGTPYVFSSRATDEQVEGVLKFFEYIGRTPFVSDISKAAMRTGYETAKLKGQPVLPTIKPWINEEYVTFAKGLEDEYVTVDMDYYGEFFSNINSNKHSEVPYAAQEMYEYLDTAIQSVLSNPDIANPYALLTSANGKLQNYLDEHYN